MICGLSIRVLQHRARFPRLHKPPWFCVPVLRVAFSGGEGKAPAEPLSCHSEYCSIWLVRRRRINRYGSAPLVLGGEIVSALLFRGRVRHSRWLEFLGELYMYIIAK